MTYEITVSGSVWTKFWDMHSGGSLKERKQFILIQAPQALAELVFYNRFGHAPNRITCTCCGEDYTVDEAPTVWAALRWNWRNDSIYGKFAKEHSDVMRNRMAALEAMASQDDSPQEAENARMAIRRQKRRLQWTRHNVIFIPREDIKPHEMTGSIPVQGWVWQ